MEDNSSRENEILATYQTLLEPTEKAMFSPPQAEISTAGKKLSASPSTPQMIASAQETDCPLSLQSPSAQEIADPDARFHDSNTIQRSMADPFTENILATVATTGALDNVGGIRSISDHKPFDENDVLNDKKMRILIETIKPSFRGVVTGKQIVDFVAVMCMVDAEWEVQAAIKEMGLNMTGQEFSRHMATFYAKTVGISDDFLSKFRRLCPRHPLEQQLEQESVVKRNEGEGENSFEKAEEADKEELVEKTKESDHHKNGEEKKEFEGEKAKDAKSAKLEIHSDSDTERFEAHTRKMVSRGERVILTGYLIVIGISILVLGFGLMQQYSVV